MSKGSKGVKTAICRISSEEFCVNEMYQNGYSKEHLSKYSKMRKMARKQYGKDFTMNDYRRMFGFPMVNRGRPASEVSEKDTQLLANWAMSPF